MHSWPSQTSDNITGVNITGPASSRLRVPGRLAAAALAAVLLTASGCRDNQVGAYRIPKEHDPATPASEAHPAPATMSAGPTDMAATAVVTATGAGLTWTAPASWQTKALGPMRKGSFTIPGSDAAIADLSITAFPGAVGGELANINRWRGQLSLPPISEADLPDTSSRVTVGDLVITVVDIAGTGDQPQRILGAMAPYNQAMWFFKLMGPDALVSTEKPAFLAFLQTIKAAGPTP
jgi:hypothetical protein